MNDPKKRKDELMAKYRALPKEKQERINDFLEFMFTATDEQFEEWLHSDTEDDNTP